MNLLPSIPEWHAFATGFSLGTLARLLDSPRPLEIALTIATGGASAAGGHWRDANDEAAYLLVSMLAGYGLTALLED